MSSFAPLLAAVAPVFIMLAVGWIMRRTGALQPEADASILKLGVNVFYPALIADTILGNPALQRFENVLLPAALGCITTLLGFAVALAGARLLRLPHPRTSRTFAFTVGLQNYGFIAIPLVDVLFGRGTLGVQFTFTLGVEVALWSVGIWLLAGANAGSREASSVRPQISMWRAMLTPPVIAIIVSVIINYVAGDSFLPGFGRTAMKWLGACAFPSQIILTGAVLADVIRRAAAGNWVKPIVFGSIIRLAILPVLILALLSRIGGSAELHHVVIVQAAMPSAMIPVILVKHYDGDVDVSAWLVTITTALGVITIPFWLRVGLWWTGG